MKLLGGLQCLSRTPKTVHDMVCAPIERIVQNLEPSVRKIELCFFMKFLPHFLARLQQGAPDVER